MLCQIGWSDSSMYVAEKGTRLTAGRPIIQAKRRGWALYLSCPRRFCIDERRVWRGSSENVVQASRLCFRLTVPPISLLTRLHSAIRKTFARRKLLPQVKIREYHPFGGLPQRLIRSNERQNMETSEYIRGVYGVHLDAPRLLEQNSMVFFRTHSTTIDRQLAMTLNELRVICLEWSRDDQRMQEPEAWLTDLYKVPYEQYTLKLRQFHFNILPL